MKIVNLLQGSQEWHAHRAQHFNASDAPAMMSCSPYKTRDELIAELATGVIPEVGAAQQRIFDAGHQFEALARPLAEGIIGEELYPVVGADGKYSASFDGLTMLEEDAFEHKSLNAVLREAMTEGCTGADLPLQYQVQMEQQAMVSGCARILFMASKWGTDRGTGEMSLIEERHCWYSPNLELRERILTGWEQLEKEVAAYQPQATEPKPRPEAKIRDALPVLRIEARGEITASTLDSFKDEVLDRINSVNAVLETDQQFADADADAKWLRDVSAAMKLAAKKVRSDMQSVDDVLNVLEQLDLIATRKAIDLEKSVKSEKDVRKQLIVHDAQQALDAHVVTLNQRLRANWIPRVNGGFGEVVKGKKSLSNMEDAVAAALTNAKHDANVLAKRLETNRAHLVQEDGDWIALFADFAAVGAKWAEDFEALAALRIGNHKQAEAKRLEAERQKIRAEEAEKLRREAEAQERAEAKRKSEAEAAAAAAEREAKRKAEEVEAAAARGRALQAAIDAEAAIAAAHKEEALPAPLLNDLSAVATHVRDEAIATVDANQAISAAKSSAPAAAAVDVATMNITQINAMLLPIFKTDAAGLSELGFTPSITIGSAKHFPASDVPKILAAMVRHLQGLMVAA